ncbi:MAG: bifunctional oligoribonuclease/PAP phosphatase NrnA [Rhizobacter sp.]|nr:bifunctional oligoribonuclease/PAP phosphatase NrnA [Bacteriovorax sp.]
MNITERFQFFTKKADNIVISTHIIPDADGIGSEIALCLAMRSLGKNAICVNEEPLLERYKYLDPDDVVISRADYLEFYPEAEIDLFIVTDTNSLERIGDGMKAIAQKAPSLLFIDHHPCPKEVMAENCIDTSKAATGELAGELIMSLGVPLNREMALPLYTAILIDTSSFRYPTVTGNTHRLIGSLMDTGVRPPHAYNMIYGTKKISYMKLLGKVLASAHTTKDEKIAWLTITDDLLEKFHVDSEDTLAFINHLLVLDNIKVAIMFREMGTEIKVSLRSIGTVDVGVMARALGGGGHDHSAAAIIKGSLDTVIKPTVEKLHEMLLHAEAKETLKAHSL